MTILTDDDLRLIQDAADAEAEGEYVPDYSDQLDAIASAIGQIDSTDLKPIATAIAGVTKAVATLGATSNAVQSLSLSVADIADAVRAIQIRQTDLSEIVAAIEANTKAIQALAKAQTAPRSLVFDKSGDPVGLRVDRPN